MFPRGAIWQRLRGRALDTVPEGVHAPYSKPETVSGWLRSGSYSAASITAKSFTISTSPLEIGAALLSDSAFHLDHAAEHSIHIRHQLAAGLWFSRAWQTVTFYYWSFFLALSITRLTGTTCAFLSRDLALKLSAISGGGVGSGAWAIRCRAATSLGHRDVELRRSQKSRLHELVWSQLFELFESCLLEADGGQGNWLEERFFEAFRRSSKTLGPAWPSDLRNIVNYRPGVGYAAVRRGAGLDAFARIKTRSAYEFEPLLEGFENAVAALPRSIEEDIPAATRALVHLTFLLSWVAESLQLEVVDRRSIDRRWTTARGGFKLSQGTQYDDRYWPMAL